MQAKKDIAWGKRNHVVLDVGCGVASFGIPAISAVMGTKRLPFPGRVFDVVHCARCGKILLELDRLLRPGGYFVWSATPIYQKLPEDAEIWEAMSALTRSMCWKMVNKVKDYRTPSLESPRIAHTSLWISSCYARISTEVDITDIHRLNTIIKYNTEFITTEA
ncbi:probable methyltransferase PMT27 isoform X6 [Phragmites australis]|uniref:probable methyltransferase PMT27 isoform X6 n=1 Tax=Phragmites australis TaxID=29695 RepID=UPI002D7731B8|nr:probable methyltransferase PMT27 isoform X6 [Phragmites australis]